MDLMMYERLTEKLDDIEDKLNLILEKQGIKQEDDIDDDLSDDNNPEDDFKE